MRTRLACLALAFAFAACDAPKAPPPPPPIPAQPPLPAAPAPPAPPAAAPYVPGLGEIMTLTQMRHAKLWLALEAKNWELASYELDELEEGFADAAAFHPHHKDAPRPIDELLRETMEGPIAALREAIAARDLQRAESAHDALTSGCNTCHEAAGFGFNRVVRPRSNAYANQDFAP